MSWLSLIIGLFAFTVVFYKTAVVASIIDVHREISWRFLSMIAVAYSLLGAGVVAALFNWEHSQILLLLGIGLYMLIDRRRL